jgi:hypothetical protein
VTGLLNRLGSAAPILKYPRAGEEEVAILVGLDGEWASTVAMWIFGDEVTNIVRLLMWEYGTYDGAASAITRKDTARRLRKD